MYVNLTREVLLCIDVIHKSSKFKCGTIEKAYNNFATKETKMYWAWREKAP